MTALNALPTTQLGRRVPTDPELEVMTLTALTTLVTAQRDFTAYDVTVALRIATPGDEIAHDRVKAVVHTAMQGLHAQYPYTATSAQFSTGTALLYQPVVAVAASVSAQPAIAAQQPAQGPSAPSSLLLKAPSQ